MAGKPNLPGDTEERDDLRRAARPTPGLSPLDQEREASMADEGGSSGAVMESEEEEVDPNVAPQDSNDPSAKERPRGQRMGALAALAGLTGLVSFALVRRWRL